MAHTAISNRPRALRLVLGFNSDPIDDKDRYSVLQGIDQDQFHMAQETLTEASKVAPQ